MRMKLPFLSLIFLLLFSANSFGQIKTRHDLPPNPIVGRCYEKCLEYDKKAEWKEIDCTLAENRVSNPTIEQKQEKIKLIKYQEKLKSIGYDVEVNGLIDRKTVDSHHKYLKYKKREERKLMRLSKK